MVSSLITPLVHIADIGMADISNDGAGRVATTALLLLGVVFILAVLVLAVAFPIWMLIDAINRPQPNKTMLIVVLAASFFFGFGFIAALIYFLTDRKKYPHAPATTLQQWQPTVPPAGTDASWPTTSPTANTEAPNPTDPPVAAEEEPRNDSTPPQS